MPLVEVKTRRDEQEFQTILSSGWKEKQWEQYAIKGQNYLFKDINGKSFGTITILNYNPDRQSFVNHIYCFDQTGPIRNNIEHTIELDQFTILKEKRGFKAILLCAKDTAKEVLKNAEIKYCIAIMEPHFFNRLKRIFGKSMVALSEPIYQKEDNSLFIPFYFDVEVARQYLRRLKLIKV